MASAKVLQRLTEIVQNADPSVIFGDNDSLWEELDATTAPAARSSELSKSLDKLKHLEDDNCEPLKRYKTDDSSE